MNLEGGENSEEVDACHEESDILQKLFFLDLEEIVQKIFLYLDPKSLKNCKLTCSEWREFIGRRIWNSKSAKQELKRKLWNQWKSTEPLRMENVDLADYVHYMVCDEKVIACGLEGGDVVVFDISTHQQLYNHSPEIADTYPPQMDLGDDYIIVVYNRMVKILEKMSGSLQYQGTPLSSRDIYGIKMIGNVGIAGDQKGNICVIEKESETSEKWTEKIQSSGIKEITHIEGVDNILVIGSRTVIQMWDWKNQKLVNSTNQIKSKVWMLQYVPPHIFVVGGEDWKGFKVIDINTGKLLRHFKIGDFPFHNVHVNERFIIFCELRPFFGEKDKIEVMIFDMHQLIDEKIEDKDLWHKCYQFIPNFSQVNAVSINTKMIVSYRCTATIYDFWKAEDCEEVSDLSTNSKLVIFPNADYSDSDDNDFEYHPQIILNHDFDNHPQIVLDNDNQNESENEMGEDENNDINYDED